MRTLLVGEVEQRLGTARQHCDGLVVQPYFKSVKCREVKESIKQLQYVGVRETQ